MAQNIRRSLTESYDPKQRIVGGIVLFLLMLLLYLILKIILGISSSLHGGNYLPQEKIFEGNEVYEKEFSEQTVGSPATTGNKVSEPRKPSRPLPLGFVFLNMNGNPFQEEFYQTVEETPRKVETTAVEGTHWVVQAGSFLEEDRAQRLIQELKNEGMDSEIVKISKWFTVRLLPQPDRQAAEQQLRQLRQAKNIRGLIKKIE